MKKQIIFLVVGLTIVSCQPKPLIEETPVVENGDPVRPARASLICEFLGEDEFGVPHNEVYLEYNGIRSKEGECLACDKITPESYSQYDIPSGATDACGGWYAGGGDYFYIMQYHDRIEYFAGWQDEGQIEENDTSFHWELKSTFSIEN